MDRKSEVRRLLQLSTADVIAQAGEHLAVCKDLEELHRLFATMIAEEAAAARAAEAAVGPEDDNPCTMIVPVGPTGGYPHLADMVISGDADLSNCSWFFMDEYCAEDDAAVSDKHPLSFKGVMHELFFGPVKAAGNEAAARLPGQVVFPDHSNVSRLAQQIESVGGIDTCYGGIGIHGHVAFNEPEPGVAELGPRRVRLNDFTVTINAVRAGVGGNLEAFPREAFTLGMEQILASRRIALFARNGTDFDWANTVLRLALFGEPGDDYPVTHIRNRNYLIVTDRETLAQPRHLI